MLKRSAEELGMRELIVPKLRERWPAARIIHELPLRYSTNRIDLAAVTPTELIGVEIKSSRDVLDRLEAQIRAFMPVTHRLWVCLAPKHNEELPHLRVDSERGGYSMIQQHTPAQKIIERVGDQYVETWSADVGTAAAWQTRGGWLRMHNMRLPWAARMLDMLWNDELAQLVGGAGDRHDSLVARANQVMTGSEAVRGVCRMLRARDAFGAASDPPILGIRKAPAAPAEAETAGAGCSEWLAGRSAG